MYFILYVAAIALTTVYRISDVDVTPVSHCTRLSALSGQRSAVAAVVRLAAAAAVAAVAAAAAAALGPGAAQPAAAPDAAGQL